MLNPIIHFFKVQFSEHCTQTQVLFFFLTHKHRIGKTRDLFKKIRDAKGTFHAKMGSIKDRNGMDLTEEEEMARKHRRTLRKRSS